MKVTRSNISASKVELLVQVSAEEMLRFSKLAATHLSERTPIEGFRLGKAPFEMVKARVGDMAIMEEASRIAISKTIDEALKENVSEDWIGQPEITISKLAPENDFDYKALITLLPAVKLGEYKNLGLKGEKAEVLDSDVEKVIEHLRDSRVIEIAVDREAAEGDKVVLDIAMSIDNVPLEGGQDKDAAIIIGKEYLVPGFDKNLIGLKKDEERNFTVHFPAGHHQKNLADKKVDFVVKTKDIFSRELPKVDDDFVKSFGLTTAADLSRNIRESLQVEKKQEAERKLEHAILEKIVKNSTVAEIPESLIEGEIQNMFHELEHNVTAQGGRMEDYLTSLGKTTEALRVEFQPQGAERVRASLVLRAIIKEEKIEVAHEKVHEEIAMLKKRYASDPKAIETLSTPAYHRHIESLLLNREVVAKLVEWNSSKS